MAKKVKSNDFKELLETLLEKTLNIPRGDYSITINSLYAKIEFSEERAASHKVLENLQVESYSSLDKFGAKLSSLTHNNAKLNSKVFHKNKFVSEIIITFDYEIIDWLLKNKN